MLRSIGALALLASHAPAQESCVSCHGELGRLEAGRVHARAGVTCVTCHGGAPGAMTVEEAHAGGVWMPADGLAAVAHCGSCHSDPEYMRGYGLRTDQLLDYWTSGHGELLRRDPGARTAGCLECHGSHGILPAYDPRAPVHPRNQPETCGQCHSDADLMAAYELDSDCVALYRGSVHGQALLEHGLFSSPACADCHGSHGAMPPRFAEVGRLCGRCHVPASEAFRASPHHAAARAGAMEDCASCHGSHEIEQPATAMLLGTERGHCGACHEEDSHARAVGQAMYELLERFDRSLAESEAALERAASKGIFVDQQLAWLSQARALRSRAAPLVHAVDPGLLQGVLEPAEGMIARTQRSLDDARRGLRDRRIFVSLFALVVLLTAAALLLHAREVARRAIGFSVSSGDGARGGDAGA